MDQNKVKECIAKLKAESKKRNFTQSFDLIVNLKGLDLKKPEDQVEFFAVLHFSKGKKTKICALVGPELKDEAAKVCDKVVLADDFGKYDKKAAKKLAQDFDFFIAQANLMGKVAQSFGKIFGPRGKMPNPKAGCIVPPKAVLKPVYDKLQKTLKVSAKLKPLVQIAVGNEQSKDEEIADNIKTIHDQLVHDLPNHEHNVKSVYLKLTMSKPVKVL